MGDDFSDWSSSQFKPYYYSCIIDEQALDGKGEWEEFYEKHQKDSGVYRITCQYPVVELGVKYTVIYMGQTGKRKRNIMSGLGWRTACYIDTPRDNEHDTRIRNRVQSLVKERNHGQIILEYLKTENNKIIEAMLLTIHESIHGRLPLENREIPALSKPREPDCKLLGLVEDNLRKG